MENIESNAIDTAAVSTILAGNSDAYAGIMARYEAKLHRYVVYLIHDGATADDVVQDTFIKAYKNLHGFNPKYKFSSWIYRIAHNEAMNAVKKQRHLTDEDISELPDMGYNQLTEELIDSTILKKHVQDCLRKLDPKYREVIQLIYFEHMKYEEVSDILHIPTSTAGMRVSHAKSRLKELCEKQGVKR